MSDNLKDILNNSNKDIDNQQLMDYLSKKLSAQDHHELEKLMADDAFMNDAVEGLEQIGDTKKLGVSVEELNKELQKQLAKRKMRKDKRKFKEQPWTYIAVLILLLLIIICYIVVKKYFNTAPAQTPKTTAALFYKLPLKQ